MKPRISYVCPLLFAIGLSLAGGRGAQAQNSSLRSLHHANMPPGMIGQQQLLRSPTLPGYFQAVEVIGPEGVQVAPIMNGQFIETQTSPVLLGMQIGFVYQLKVTNIPFHEGVEIYPTIELINRLYPPEGTKLRFPVPIELTSEEINMALKGQYVTRVIYLEDPETALPQLDDPQHQRVIEVGPREDPLHMADRLGRPLAILRMGSRVPELDPVPSDSGFGSPPVQIYPRPIKKTPVKGNAAGVMPAIERHGQDVPRISEPAVPPASQSSIPFTDQP